VKIVAYILGSIIWIVFLGPIVLGLVEIPFVMLAYSMGLGNPMPGTIVNTGLSLAIVAGIWAYKLNKKNNKQEP